MSYFLFGHGVKVETGLRSSEKERNGKVKETWFETLEGVLGSPFETLGVFRDPH